MICDACRPNERLDFVESQTLLAGALRWVFFRSSRWAFVHAYRELTPQCRCALRASGHSWKPNRAINGPAQPPQAAPNFGRSPIAECSLRLNTSAWIEIESAPAPMVDQFIRLARYFFFSGMGAAGFTCVAANDDAGTADFTFDCLGFFCSRLLRCCPLAICSPEKMDLVKGSQNQTHTRSVQCLPVNPPPDVRQDDALAARVTYPFRPCHPCHRHHHHHACGLRPWVTRRPSHRWSG
jgi:hypothetical protein